MNLQKYVSEILDDLKENKMEALMRYSKKFDDYDGSILVNEDEYETINSIPDEDKQIIDETIERIKRYHEKEVLKDMMFKNNKSFFELVKRPIRRVGLYIPGGKPLPSTVMMTAIPAIIAGVKEIVLVSSPKDGKINEYILYIAKKLGIKKIYKVGGIQAIAAMTYGIGMKRVDKIFGPGNKFVNEAKRQVFGDVGIDSLAGPSEICVIADENANPEYILNDLLSQKEHGEDSKAWLVTNSKKIYDSVKLEDVIKYLEDDLEKCAERANEIAPEHLEIMTENPEYLLSLVYNAGAVYLGDYTPVPSADYFIGTNHVLPTGNSARFGSVLSVFDFMRVMSVAKMDKEDYMNNRKLGLRLAEIENMPQHRKSMEVRK